METKREKRKIGLAVDAALFDELRDLAREQRRTNSGELEMAMRRHIDAVRRERRAEPVAAAG